MTTTAPKTIAMTERFGIGDNKRTSIGQKQSEKAELRKSSCDSSLARTTTRMPLHSSETTLPRSIHSSLSFGTASLLLRGTAKISSSTETETPKGFQQEEPATQTRSTSSASRNQQQQPPQSQSQCPLLDSVPKEVLARDILGFLTDKGVKTFFDSLGEDRLNSASCSELRNQFCLCHGSRLEDEESFVTIPPFVGSDGKGEESEANNNTNNTTRQKKTFSFCQIIRKPNPKRKHSSCPECHSEQRNTKRCHGCKVFYPNSGSGDGSTNKAFPGLSCQKCDHMAYCRSCLSSNEKSRCNHGPDIPATTTTTLFASHGRKHRLGSNNRHGSSSSSCHNYCCSSVFTNTMCGEFICMDCTDENQKLLRGLGADKNSSSSSSSDAALYSAETSGASVLETCQDCGKSTCLDPHCLVCADFKLVHMVCKFSPEDAYKVDIIGGLLFGSQHNGSNLNLSTKLRRNLSDCFVWILVGMMLSKMWWFKKQQELEQELLLV